VPASTGILFASKDAIPLESMLDCVVNAPVVAFLLTVVKPPSDRIGPEKVVLAISISLSWQMSKLILRQG
jgi:hypothetical protein